MVQPFKRALGLFDAVMIVIGGIIGAGIFINPYIVAQRLDSSGLVLGAWLAGAAALNKSNSATVGMIGCGRRLMIGLPF